MLRVFLRRDKIRDLFQVLLYRRRNRRQPPRKVAQQGFASESLRMSKLPNLLEKSGALGHRSSCGFHSYTAVAEL
jgi:hypothetical protein